MTGSDKNIAFFRIFIEHLVEIIRKNAVSRYLRHFLVLVPAPVLIVEAVNSVTHLTVYTERHIHTVDVSITGKLFKLKAMQPQPNSLSKY